MQPIGTDMNNTNTKYKHALYIDLEYSCWDGPRPSGCDLEIIEIGAVEVDLESLAITKEAAYLVRPRHLEISLRCTQITGITAPDLRPAKRLPEVLAQLEDDFGPGEKVCVAWGNDIDMLAGACRQYRIRTPFKKGVDLSQLLRHLLLLKEQPSLHDGINMLGISFDGVAHTALADARNTARIHAELLRRVRSEQDPIPDRLDQPDPRTTRPTYFAEKLLGALRANCNPSGSASE